MPIGKPLVGHLRISSRYAVALFGLGTVNREHRTLVRPLQRDGAAINNAAPPIIPSVRSCFMIGLHDHHRAHSTRVARTVEKTFASVSPGHYCDNNAAIIEIVQLFPPSVSRVMGRASQSADGRISQTRQTKRCACRSSAHASLGFWGDGRDHKDTTLGAKPRRGNEEGCADEKRNEVGGGESKAPRRGNDAERISRKSVPTKFAPRKSQLFVEPIPFVVGHLHAFFEGVVTGS